jgi:hypothetical protein
LASSAFTRPLMWCGHQIFTWNLQNIEFNKLSSL